MKNLCLLLAFTGMLNAALAINFTKLEKWKPLTVKQDGKKGNCKKDSTHHNNCSKHAKSKCEGMKKDSTHHDCSAHPKGKCCKMKKDSVAH